MCFSLKLQSVQLSSYWYYLWSKILPKLPCLCIVQLPLPFPHDSNCVPTHKIHRKQCIHVLDKMQKTESQCMRLVHVMQKTTLDHDFSITVSEDIVNCCLLPSELKHCVVWLDCKQIYQLLLIILFIQL